VPFIQTPFSVKDLAANVRETLDREQEQGRGDQRIGTFRRLPAAPPDPERSALC
jgi:hypothetical protein